MWATMKRTSRTLTSRGCAAIKDKEFLKIKAYSDSASELELPTSIAEFFDFFFIVSIKSFTKTLGGTISDKKDSSKFSGITKS